MGHQILKSIDSYSFKKYDYSLVKTCLIGDSKNDYVDTTFYRIKFRGYNKIRLKDLDCYVENFNFFKFYLLQYSLKSL